MEQNQVNELLNEYKTVISISADERLVVTARIYKYLSGDQERFTCEFSHFCKQFEGAAGVYTPGSSDHPDFHRVQHVAQSYLESFKNIDVTVNEGFF